MIIGVTVIYTCAFIIIIERIIIYQQIMEKFVVKKWKVINLQHYSLCFKCLQNNSNDFFEFYPFFFLKSLQCQWV